ncbi:cx9C motif-containing protein 4 [Cynoglossus semilaevis]|uniref:cx9C motif-containing protein 4 n=1 Tax=Cynoglossus semilaevis TaxID=244447 RepID=UPI00049677A2|nr:cx9C motif-containing protein 4 [Cynoglossus semilaevis]
MYDKACEIQKCLQANRYLESMCQEVIREMRRCCETQAEKSLCCSGFRDSKPAEEEKDKT